VTEAPAGAVAPTEGVAVTAIVGVAVTEAGTTSVAVTGADDEDNGPWASTPVVRESAAIKAITATIVRFIEVLNFPMSAVHEMLL
jgi:hypothetical protein